MKIKRVSRKTRKLAFIQTKNAVRRGREVRSYARISKQLKEGYSDLLEQMGKRNEQLVSKQFRLPLTYRSHEVGRGNYDFFHNTYTVLYTYKVAWL